MKTLQKAIIAATATVTLSAMLSARITAFKHQAETNIPQYESDMNQKYGNDWLTEYFHNSVTNLTKANRIRRDYYLSVTKDMQNASQPTKWVGWQFLQTNSP